MMKPVLLIFVFFHLVFTHTVFSQEKAIRIKYLLEFKIDSTDLGNVDRENMNLDVLPKSKSHFQSESLFMKDSILSSQNPQSLFGVGKPKYKYHVVKDYKENRMDVYYDYTAYKFKIKEDVRMDWKIVNDSTKTILGQKCKMATTSFRGRNYTAWYSTEVLISDGPYKFKGLPGLILEIYDKNNHYHFEAFSLQTMADYNDYLAETDYTTISKSDFKDFQIKINKKPSLILYNPGIQIPKEGLDKYDKTHRERGKHKNNPIELTDE